MKNFFLNSFLGLFIGLVIAFGFDSIFLNLSGRPVVDQALLLFFSSAAFGYLAYLLIESGRAELISFRFEPIRINRALVFTCIREHAAGLLLALFFIGIYTFIGLKLNQPAFDTVDNFLDADNFSWMARIAGTWGYKLEMRGPHPYAYFIFRPLGWFLNFFTQRTVLTAILLNTFTGGLCVFLAWEFIHRQTGSRMYASLIGSLLGFSTAHVFFGSVIESYIFSAAALIGFFLLIQAQRNGTNSLVVVSLITFGITVTNFVQNFIGFVVSRRRFSDIVRFTGITISMGIVLSLIHAAWYPSSRLFFLLSDAQAESDFKISVFNDPAWRAFGRVLLLVRTILLYTVIAPQPYVFVEEVGGTFPRFNFFKIVPGTFSHSAYDGLGNILAFAWVFMLLVSGVFFLVDLIRTRKPDLKLAFVLCILFNFVLHLNYGYEPFLYSPDWAYALIFFVGLSLAPLARSKIFQGGLLIFLILLAYSQLQFFRFIFQTIEPFWGQG